LANIKRGSISGSELLKFKVSLVFNYWKNPVILNLRIRLMKNNIDKKKNRTFFTKLKWQKYKPAMLEQLLLYYAIN